MINGVMYIRTSIYDVMGLDDRSNPIDTIDGGSYFELPPCYVCTSSVVYRAGLSICTIPSTGKVNK